VTVVQPEPVDQALRELRGQGHVPLGRGPDGGDDLVPGGALGQHAVHAGVDDPGEHLVVHAEGEGDHARGRRALALAEPLDQADAGEARQVQLGDDDVRTRRAHQRDGVHPAVGRADDLHPGLAPDESAYRVPHDGKATADKNSLVRARDFGRPGNYFLRNVRPVRGVLVKSLVCSGQGAQRGSPCSSREIEVCCMSVGFRAALADVPVNIARARHYTDAGPSCGGLRRRRDEGAERCLHAFDAPVSEGQQSSFRGDGKQTRVLPTFHDLLQLAGMCTSLTP
jgi:hypothetical protein